MAGTDTSHIMTWEAGALRVEFTVNSDQTIRMSYLGPAATLPITPASPYFQEPWLPLAEVRTAGEGTKQHKTSKHSICTYVGYRLQYRTHEASSDGQKSTFEVTTSDPLTSLKLVTKYEVYKGSSVLRSTVTIYNNSSKEVTILQLSSFVLGGLSIKSEKWWDDYVLSIPRNSMFREAQWTDHSLPSVGVDDAGFYELHEGHEASCGTCVISNHGSFSTEGHLPMGMLKSKDGKQTWLWQIENNGSWRWEVGDWRDSLYVAASGPTDADHQWSKVLAPNESFTSVPVAICHVADGPDAAFTELNRYRRCIRRKHKDNERLPNIFNDYMNCLMGDPDEEKVSALIEPVVKAGAEYFVIDCGWYADDSNWWDDVGEWKPSRKRFPSGFKTLLGKIRAAGLIPGVWIEREVVGHRSVVGSKLPDDCFLQRNGQRILERGRYSLDFRNLISRRHMDSIIDGLVLSYGVGYFKFDYNIDVTQGTDVGATGSGSGEGFFEHNRAYLTWVGNLFDRFPDLVIENCSSGGQRMDYAMLAVHSLQSTSDQQDPVRYAANAAALPTAVTPEQSATWAYPQPGWDDETNAMTVVNSLLGRIHLSGRLDRLSAEQLGLITEGMSLYKTIRTDLATSSPFWPLGLPGWHDDWVALGMKATKNCYLSVWRRGGPESYELPMMGFKGQQNLQVDLLYPNTFPVEFEWIASIGILRITMPSVKSARLFRITASE